MAQVNLAKALKMKNALVGEINRLKEIFTRENSRSSESTSTVDRESIWAQIHEKTNELVNLKAAIAKANVGLYPYLAAMEEAKGLIAYIKGLNTVDGTVRTDTRYGTGPAVETKYTAFLTQQRVDEEVAKATKLIETAQDDVDNYNARTFIEV
jgi:hypothetical protein